MAREALRIIMRRPLPSVVAVALDEGGRVVLMRRSGGAWSLPGGLMEWGEQIEETLRREVLEETGLAVRSVGRVIGLYSHPRRDARFHSIAIAVECVVVPSEEAPERNPLEVLAVQSFAREELPARLAFDGRRILDDWARGATTLD